MITDTIEISSSTWTQLPSGATQFMLQKGSAVCSLSSNQPTKDVGYPVQSNQVIIVENPVWLKATASIGSITVVYSV